MVPERVVFSSRECQKDHLYVNKHPNKRLYSQKHAEKTTKIALATLTGGSPPPVDVIEPPTREISRNRRFDILMPMPETIAENT